MMVAIGLTHGEVVAVCTEIGLRPDLIVGERTEDELARMLAEGARSLLARGLLRIDGDEVRISVDLKDLVRALVAPSTVFTYTRVVGDQARVTSILYGAGGARAIVPLAAEVSRFEPIDLEALKTRIVDEAGLDSEEPGGFRLDAIDMADGEVRSLAWGRLPGPVTQVVREDGAEEISLETLGELVSGFFEQVEATVG